MFSTSQLLHLLRARLSGGLDSASTAQEKESGSGEFDIAKFVF